MRYGVRRPVPRLRGNAEIEFGQIGPAISVASRVLRPSNDRRRTHVARHRAVLDAMDIRQPSAQTIQKAPPARTIYHLRRKAREQSEMFRHIRVPDRSCSGKTRRYRLA